MNILQTLLAILPGLAICGWLFYRDRHQREPIVLLVLCFLAGIGCAFPSLFIQGIALDFGIKESPHIGTSLLLTFGVVAFSEELLKFSALMLFAYPWKAFDEPLDGIIYSVMVSMGFATIENVIYSNIYDISIVAMRGLTAIPAHAAFAVIMGYFVGNAKYEANLKEKLKLMGTGLGLAILIHGTYDFFLLQQAAESLVLLSIPVLVAAVYWSIRLINKQAALSRKKYRTATSGKIVWLPKFPKQTEKPKPPIAENKVDPLEKKVALVPEKDIPKTYNKKEDKWDELWEE